MKRKLLPLAIGAAVAVQAGVVMADATVYGKANISVQQNNYEYLGADQLDNSAMNSNASRIGFKGKAKVNDDMDAVFKMEYESFIDDGSDGDNNSGDEFSQRNIVAGLSSKKYGQLVGGKNDTPLKLAADGTDMFNDLALGDINNYMVGENRENNIVMYNTPVMGGVTVTLATMLGEEDGVDETSGTDINDDDTQDEGMFDRTSLAVKYQPMESLWFALSGDQNVQNADIVRFNASGILGDFTLNAHIQSAEVNNDDLFENNTVGDEGEGMAISSSRGIGLALNGPNDDYHTGIEEQDAWMLSGKYQIGDWVIKAQYGESESSAFDPTNPVTNATTTTFQKGNGFDVGDNKEFTAEQIAFGVDYALSKNVTIYGYVAQLEVDIDDASDLVDDAEMKTGGVGFEVKF